MTIRNLSSATQRSCLAAVSKLSRYFGRSPDCLELQDIRAFQIHLVAIGVSWPALNQTVCALRFFYGATLGHDAVPERISYARQPHIPATVLDDIVLSNLKSRLLTPERLTSVLEILADNLPRPMPGSTTCLAPARGV